MSPTTIPGKMTLAKEFTWNETVWNPSMLSTALWLDAADASTITESGGAVSQWDDKSGNNRNAIQATAGRRPSYVESSLNGKAGIDWGSSISSNSLVISQSFASPSVFAVADYDGPDPFDNFSGLYAASPSFYRPIFTSATGTSWLSSSTCDLNGSGSGSNAALPAISSPFIVRNVSVSDTTTKTETVIGNDSPVFNRNWRGKIYEVITLPSVPSTAARQKLEGYLAHKWGLTANLPAGHPYKLVGPTP